MQNYIPRLLTNTILAALKTTPVVAIIGPRQCGKSTLAKKIINDNPGALYVDLELPSHRNMLRDPEAFFRLNSGSIICLDEIHRLPEVFPIIRGIVDEHGQNGAFFILGSASPELLRQSSESLAGRIAYFELTPFLWDEIGASHEADAMLRLWLRGGFPRSYLADDNATSLRWRRNFIMTFLERDMPQFGLHISAPRLDRFLRICSHVHGQVLNSSRLGESLGVSYHTVRSYIDILEHTFIVRVLQPYAPNLKKRLVKSPKLYIRDSGLLHALHDIEDHNQLLAHPMYGASWEGFALEQIIGALPDWKPYFYRTASGAEIDLVLEKAGRRVAVEAKASSAPEVTKKLRSALEDVVGEHAWIVAPVDRAYPVDRNITVAPIGTVVEQVRRMGQGKC